MGDLPRSTGCWSSLSPSRPRSFRCANRAFVTSGNLAWAARAAGFRLRLGGDRFAPPAMRYALLSALRSTFPHADRRPKPRQAPQNRKCLAVPFGRKNPSDYTNGREFFAHLARFFGDLTSDWPSEIEIRHYIPHSKLRNALNSGCARSEWRHVRAEGLKQPSQLPAPNTGSIDNN